MTAHWSLPVPAWPTTPARVAARAVLDGLTIEIGRRLATVVVVLRGTLDALTATTLATALGDLIDGQGNLAVAVDLGDVQRVTPAGLQVLSAAAGNLERRGGNLSLEGTRDSVPLSSLDSWGLSCLIAVSSRGVPRSGPARLAYGRSRAGHPAGRGLHGNGKGARP